MGVEGEGREEGGPGGEVPPASLRGDVTLGGALAAKTGGPAAGRPRLFRFPPRPLLRATATGSLDSTPSLGERVDLVGEGEGEGGGGDSAARELEAKVGSDSDSSPSDGG
jgi:hypothetical protein